MNILLTLLGLNRAGRVVYVTLFVLAVPALVGWFVVLPRLRFHDEDERLFRAARHGDIAGAEASLAAGGRLNVAAPIDGKTALFRAAVVGHADLVRMLIKHGADLQARGNDGQTALEVALAARGDEHDAARAQALDAVIAVLRTGEAGR
jgi:hypothetical protein